MCAFRMLFKVLSASLAYAIKYGLTCSKMFPLTPKHKFLVIGEDTDRLGDDKGSSLLWHRLSNDSRVQALLLIILYMN